MFIKVLLTIVALLSAYFVFLSFTAKKPEVGLVDGKLRNCPGKPNCVCSDSEGSFYVAPVPAESLESIAKAIAQIGGEVQQQDDQWLWATFSSRVFRFIDDLEVRFDAHAGLAYVRSASRSGTSDFGVNRKRIEALRLAVK